MKFKKDDIVICVNSDGRFLETNKLYKIYSHWKHQSLNLVQMTQVYGIDYDYSSSRFKLIKVNKLNKKLYPEMVELLK